MHRRLIFAAVLASGIGAISAASAEELRTVIYFTADSAGLDDSAMGNIRQAAAAAERDPRAPIRVVGFAAPDSGSAIYNKILSQARAQNVTDALVTAGVPGRHIHIEVHGAKSFQSVPTESRRVDIVIGK